MSLNLILPIPAYIDSRYDNVVRQPIATNIFGKYHKGLDFFYKRKPGESFNPPYGTLKWFMNLVPVLASESGEVKRCYYSKNKGWRLIIHHSLTWSTFYTHMSKVYVNNGNVVKKGQPIGIVGKSPDQKNGLYHLHFELWKNGKPINPIKYLPTKAMGIYEYVDKSINSVTKLDGVTKAFFIILLPILYLLAKRDK